MGSQPPGERKMNPAHNRLALAGLALAVCLSGCGPKPSAAARGDGETATPTAATPNACDVLDAATARKYLGDGAVLRRKAQPNPRMTQCQYGSDKGVITVMVGPWSMIHMATSGDKPVAGLGDEAYVGPTGLYVRKGDRAIDLNVMVVAGEFWGKAADDVEAQTIAAEEKVAPDLLARL